jgi:biotin carboxyl carrier protein
MAAYIVTHQGQEHALRVQESQPGLYAVKLDGRELLVDCSVSGNGTLSLIIDGRCYEVDVDGAAGGDQRRVTIQRRHFDLEVVDDRRKRLAGKRAMGMSGRQEVRAPMPGSISKVLVSEGDAVAAGQVLMVLDAMKMANELAAPLTGVVRSLGVRQGASVTTNELLCVVLPPNLDPP